MASSTSKLISLRSVLSESRRLIISQPRCFFSLGFLFLFPPFLTAAIFQSLLSDAVSSTFLNPIFTTSASPDHDHHDNHQSTITPRTTLLLALVCLLFNSTLYLCAVGSVTYAAFHGFYGEAIKPKSARNSIATSFFPLLATTLLSHALVSFLVIIFAVVFMAVIGGASLLGFQAEVSSPFFIAFSASMVVLLVLVVIHLQVNWALASVVVVAESTWGFEALKRSRTLIKGRRWLSFSLSLIFGFLYLMFGWYSTCPDTDENNWTCYVILILFVVQVVEFSGLRMLFKLYEMAANTALYIYCQANIRDGKGSGREHYVELAVDY